MVSKITVARIPPAMTTVPADIRNPLHQQPITSVFGSSHGGTPGARWPFAGARTQVAVPEGRVEFQRGEV